MENTIPRVGLANAHRHWMNRRIRFITLPDGRKIHEISDCDTITPYSEPGDMSMIIWFEVKWKDGSFERFNGLHLASIQYWESDAGS